MCLLNFNKRHTSLNLLTKGTIKRNFFFYSFEKKLVDKTDLKLKRSFFKILIAEYSKYILNAFNKKSL